MSCAPAAPLVIPELQELPTDIDALESMLEGRLVLTRYNGWLYAYRSVSPTLTIDCLMPPTTKRGVQRPAVPVAASVTKEGGKDGAEVVAHEEEKPITFREYYACVSARSVGNQRNLDAVVSSNRC